MSGALLIIRAMPEAQNFADLCGEAGIEARAVPVIKRVVLAPDLPDEADYDAVVVTSASAIMAVSGRDLARGKPVFCVGPQTVKAAVEAGFSEVLKGDGDAQSLVGVIMARGCRRVLYLRGRDVSFDMASALNEHGIACEQSVVYAMEAAEDGVSADIISDIHQGLVSGVAFFSKRTAEIFCGALEHAAGHDVFESLKALCISQGVVECVQTYSWKSIHISNVPEREGMLDLAKGIMNEKTVERREMSSVAKNKQAIENATEVIERFGGIRPMAKKIDVAVTTIQGWKKRDTIPAGRKDAILEAAAEHDIDLTDIVTGAPEVNPEAANENGSADVSSDGETKKPLIENPADYEVQKASYEAEAPEKDDEAEASKPTSVPSAKQEEPVMLSEPLDQKIAEAQKEVVIKSTWISIALVLIAIAAVAALLWPQKQNTDRATQRLGALEQDLDAIEGDVEAVKAQQSFFGALIPDDLDEQLNSLKEKAVATQEQVGMAYKKAKEVSNDVLAEDAGTMDERIVKLQSHVSEVMATPQMQGLLERYNIMQADDQGQSQLGLAMGELNAILGNMGETTDATLNQTLDAARERSTAMGETFEGVPSTDLKAAALLLGMSQFRSSLNRDNEAFASDLEVLKKLVGEENVEMRAAIERLAPHAESGVLTPSGLSNEFKTLAGDAVVSSLSGEDVSLGEKAQARFNELFQVEKNGELVTGTPTQAALKEADTMLQNGDLEGAVAAVERLDGDAAQVMQPWLKEAQVTIMTQKIKSMMDALMNGQKVNMSDFGLEALMPEGAGNAAQGLGDAMGDIGIPGMGSKLVRDPESGYSILKK